MNFFSERVRPDYPDDCAWWYDVIDGEEPSRKMDWGGKDCDDDFRVAEFMLFVIE